MRRLTILGLMLALCLALPGCELEKPQSETQFAGVGTLSTVVHDGHKFVICSRGEVVSVMLHPDDGKAEKE